MKKIVLSAGLFVAAAVLAGAQNMYDAITFSQNHYYGTARSMALGNAMTALGGDLGSIGINPAGSAVAPYGQFVITPGLTVSSVSSAFSPEGEDAYGLSGRLTNGRMNLPNIGVSFNLETGKRYGLKGVTIGFLSNQTDNYNFDAEGFGTNTRSSRFGEMAWNAYGMEPDILNDGRSFDNSDIPWDLLAAYQSGMFGEFAYDGDKPVFAGITETIAPDLAYTYVPGALAQTSYRTKSGSKNDLILNVGFNFSDKLYFGFNLGLPTGRYRYSESYYEAAADPIQFPIDYENGTRAYFKRAGFNYQYTADVNGIYAKVGIIARPVKGLRLGASFQTPTAYTISETWQYSGRLSLVDDPGKSASSPVGEYSYSLRSPYIATFGAAFTFGKSGFISADYELADYSVMRFRDAHERWMTDDRFQAQNQANRYFAGVSRAFRLGGEMRLSAEWSVRAGYSVSTSPERYWTNTDGEEVTADSFLRDYDSYAGHSKNLVSSHYYGDKTRTWSCGFGYSSPGSFFMDASLRKIRYADSTFSPYYDYEGSDKYGSEQYFTSPKILNHYDLWSVALTLGWRF
ncbi:MAG: hypothetical protein K6E35_06605 [Bacteroidales bacterium]|nr:hypothetical protein [Bacteroidales bacterium]